MQRRTSTVSFVAHNSRKISEHATLTVIEPCTILLSPHHLSHLPRLRAVADLATSKEQEMQNSFMRTIWSTWEHISCLAPNLGCLGNVRLIYFRPAQTISQGMCELSGLSVPIHYTHTHTHKHTPRNCGVCKCKTGPYTQGRLSPRYITHRAGEGSCWQGQDCPQQAHPSWLAAQSRAVSALKGQQGLVVRCEQGF